MKKRENKKNKFKVIKDTTILYIKNKKILIDTEDLERIIKYRWCISWAGSRDYLFIKTNIFIDNSFKNIKLHRFILNINDPLICIDHIDRNPLNNKKSNLRIANRIQNQRNMKVSKKNKSGYKGVSWDKSRNKWTARISFNNHYLYLGRFDTPEDAQEAYKKASLQYHGEFSIFYEKLHS